ncbi:MAG TPA: hypothetical protein VF692_01275, partial [Pyrinomonadaceae bacterium]
MLVKQMTDAQVNYQPEMLDKIFTADHIEISLLGKFDTREKVFGFYKFDPQLRRFCRRYRQIKLCDDERRKPASAAQILRGDSLPEGKKRVEN